jgi:hypothetical protein
MMPEPVVAIVRPQAHVCDSSATTAAFKCGCQRFRRRDREPARVSAAALHPGLMAIEVHARAAPAQ